MKEFKVFMVLAVLSIVGHVMGRAEVITDPSQ